MAKKDLVSWEEEMAAAAAAAAAAEPNGGGGATIGVKGGVFRLGGNELGEELSVVVVGSSVENAYYDSAYDPDNPIPPGCFCVAEVGTDESELYPSESSPNPQSESCSDCWANEWGSSPRGTGKACKNSRRLTVLAVDDDEGVQTGEMPMLRVSPTGLNNWGNYVKRVARVLGRPPWGVVTNISFAQDVDYEKLQFSSVRSLTKEEVDEVKELFDQSEEILMHEFDVSNYEDPAIRRAARKKRAPAPKKKAATKKKATVRKQSGRSKMS